MHQHISLCEYGQFLGVRGECLLVRDGDKEQEYPLSRIKSIQIAKGGTSLSSDLLLKCAARGIKLFVCDFRNQTVACLSGVAQHAVVRVREAQFLALAESAHDTIGAELARAVTRGKLRNQRATLLYFGKYHQRAKHLIDHAVAGFDQLLNQLPQRRWDIHQWRQVLLGIEGQAAKQYWQCLKAANLFPDDFPGRSGRHASDATNMALNYGYAILTSYVWNAIINAGLEPYAGFYHTQRPGKPSLVLDLMEEYRAWIVDRAVIKLRTQLAGKTHLDPSLRKKLVTDIHKSFARRYHYHGRKLRMESILQRQVYQLAGAFVEQKTYRPYLFRW